MYHPIPKYIYVYLTWNVVHYLHFVDPVGLKYFLTSSKFRNCLFFFGDARSAKFFSFDFNIPSKDTYWKIKKYNHIFFVLRFGSIAYFSFVVTIILLFERARHKPVLNTLGAILYTLTSARQHNFPKISFLSLKKLNYKKYLSTIYIIWIRRSEKDFWKLAFEAEKFFKLILYILKKNLISLFVQN